MAERNAETNRRCVFTPYGVHVINVTRSSPGTIFNFDVSSGLISVMRSRVKIKIRDLGFGEIVKSSDLTWEYTMSL